MALLWTPDPVISPWFTTSANAAGFVGAISVASDDINTSAPARLEFVPVDFPIAYTVEYGVSSLTLTVPVWAGAFTASIGYLLNKVPGSCVSWEDLPPLAEEVISFFPSPSNLYTAVFDVKAFQQVGDTVPIVTETYEIHIIASYDAGRTSLVAAVDARRNLPHVF